MAKNRSELTRLEWVIMESLWDLGSATATDVQVAVAKKKGWAYSTVKTMLDRLVQMGYVKARRVGNVYEYSAKSKRPTVVRQFLDEMSNRFFDGSTTTFVQCLIEGKNLSPEEIAELRELLRNQTGNRGEKK